MVPVKITQQELLDALATANVAPSEARTVAELVALTGWNKKRIWDAIGKLAMQDRIMSYQVSRPAIDGSNRMSPAYAILPAKHK